MLILPIPLSSAHRQVRLCQFDPRMASPLPKSVNISALLLIFASTVLILFLLLPSLSLSSSRPSSSPDIADVGSHGDRQMPEQIVPTSDNFQKKKKNEKKKTNIAFGHFSSFLDKFLGFCSSYFIFNGISHYEDAGENHTALPCPGELLVEEHHSNYGEPRAGGRNVFEFLASAIVLQPSDLVLEVGCGTLRVGLHFIRYLDSGHYSCLERDELSLLAALRYELPSQGLLHKRPLILKGMIWTFLDLELTVHMI